MNHNQYLEECIRLAQVGETLSFPNPMVGAVIVHRGEIIARGFHREFGKGHAEANAIKQLLEQNTNAIELMSQSDIYVSLEPCSHQGKTGACTDLIKKYKFKRLIYAANDPNPKQKQEEFKTLTETEIIKPEQLAPQIVAKANFLNRVFFKVVKEKKAWITVKIAAKANGSMLTEAGESRWITNEASRQDVHRLRSTHQLLITGSNTIKEDDPELTVRHSPENLELSDIRNPDIAILKRTSKLNKNNHKIFKDTGRKVFEIESESLENTVEELLRQGYLKIMVEAGPQLSKAFIDRNLADEIIHYSPQANNSQSQILSLYPDELISSSVPSTNILEDNLRCRITKT